MAIRGVTALCERPEKLHITLAFLGWVDASQLVQIEETVVHVAAEHAIFALRLERISAFPNVRRPRIVWAGAYEVNSQYRALSTSLRTSFGEMGFAFQTNAVAHVTLCRLKHFNAPLPHILDFSPIVVNVREIAVFQSLPDGQTTRYEILRRAALQNPD